MSITRRLILLGVAVACLAAGIYSQTTPVAPPPPPKSGPPSVPQNLGPTIPAAVYSGENFGYKVTSSRGNKVEGYFVIKVNGTWIPLPEDQPSVKKLGLD